MWNDLKLHVSPSRVDRRSKRSKKYNSFYLIFFNVLSRGPWYSQSVKLLETVKIITYPHFYIIFLPVLPKVSLTNSTNIVKTFLRWDFLFLFTSFADDNLFSLDYLNSSGHSMLAEQQEVRGWSQIRGLALSTALCPWDAAMLERWARCVKCSRSRKLMNFTAHCLRAPALHDKYRVHNILQVRLSADVLPHWSLEQPWPWVWTVSLRLNISLTYHFRTILCKT